MTDMAPRPPSLWDLLTLALWSGFFAIGLAPDPVFRLMRGVASVSAPTAFVNSALTITLALSVYLALFAFRRCRESGLDEAESQGRAIQIGMMGFVAFLEIPISSSGTFEVRTLLELLFQVNNIPKGDLYLRSVVLIVGLSKLFTWWYLYTLLLRYHMFGIRNVFATMPSFFPNTRAETAPTPADVPESRAGELRPPAVHVPSDDWSDETGRD